MGLLDDTHNLYGTGHIFDPFLAYFVFGYPLLAIAVAGVWEILELAIFYLSGNYSPIFLNEEVGEEVWDVVLLDIGGAVVGTMIAYALTYYLYKTIIPPNILWNGSWKNKFLVLCIFVIRAICTMPFASMGWECTIEAWCTSSGYNLLPWGIFGYLVINGVYIYYCFKDNTELLRWLLLIMLLINAPTFQREIPASFIQITVFGAIGTIGFIISTILYSCSTKKRQDFQILVSENE